MGKNEFLHFFFCDITLFQFIYGDPNWFPLLLFIDSEYLFHQSSNYNTTPAIGAIVWAGLEIEAEKEVEDVKYHLLEVGHWISGDQKERYCLHFPTKTCSRLCSG